MIIHDTIISDVISLSYPQHINTLISYSYPSHTPRYYSFVTTHLLSCSLTFPLVPPDAAAKLEELSQFIFKHGDDRSRTRALLCSVYHHALHDRFHRARDMFLISHIQDVIEKADTKTMILYNRALVRPYPLFIHQQHPLNLPPTPSELTTNTPNRPPTSSHLCSPLLRTTNTGDVGLVCLPIGSRSQSPRLPGGYLLRSSSGVISARPSPLA